MKKRIVVLGGTGRIGNKISEIAIKRGYEVVCLGRSASVENTPLGAIPFQGNVTDINTILEVIKRADVIILALSNLYGLTPGDSNMSTRFTNLGLIRPSGKTISKTATSPPKTIIRYDESPRMLSKSPISIATPIRGPTGAPKPPIIEYARAWTPRPPALLEVQTSPAAGRRRPRSAV